MQHQLYSLWSAPCRTSPDPVFSAPSTQSVWIGKSQIILRVLDSTTASGLCSYLVLLPTNSHFAQVSNVELSLPGCVTTNCSGLGGTFWTYGRWFRWSCYPFLPHSSPCLFCTFCFVFPFFRSPYALLSSTVTNKVSLFGARYPITLSRLIDAQSSTIVHSLQVKDGLHSFSGAFLISCPSSLYPLLFISEFQNGFEPQELIADIMFL